MLVSMISGKRETDYLPQTLESVTPQIVDFGFPCRLFPDGYKPGATYPWGLEVRGHEGEPIGTRLMMRRVFEYFINETREERLLYLEDDILLCRNFIKYASQVKIESFWGLLSFHDARIRTIGYPGLVSMPVCKFLYTQAFIITREVVEKMLPMDFKTPTAKVLDGNSSDRKLGRLMLNLHFVRYGLQLPSLIFHSGEYSAVTKGLSPARGNPSFPGVEFDALSLLG